MCWNAGIHVVCENDVLLLPPPLAMQTGVYSLSIPSETARNLSRKLMQGQTDPRTSDLQSVSPWSGPGI